ncbi:type IV pilin protein [Chloroflexota bacterium]
MKRILKQLRYGEKGFTLIELLVVVAILGVIAGVAVPNVGRFIGRGVDEAQGAEQHNVQTSTMAMMTENVGVEITAGTLPVDGDGTTIVCGTDNLSNYLTGVAEFSWDVDEEGTVTPTPAGP